MPGQPPFGGAACQWVNESGDDGALHTPSEESMRCGLTNGVNRRADCGAAMSGAGIAEAKKRERMAMQAGSD